MVAGQQTFIILSYLINSQYPHKQVNQNNFPIRWTQKHLLPQRTALYELEVKSLHIGRIKYRNKHQYNYLANDAIKNILVARIDNFIQFSKCTRKVLIIPTFTI